MNQKIPERAWIAISAIAGARLGPTSTPADVRREFATAVALWSTAVVDLAESPIEIQAMGKPFIRMTRAPEGWDVQIEDLTKT